MLRNMIIHKEKLFPRPPDGKYDNIEIDNQSVSFVTPHHASMTICDLIKADSSLQNPIIFDGTAGCGGDTITFAMKFNCVISCELRSDRYQMLLNNIELYNLTNVITINTDTTKIIAHLPSIDIVYVDPPWGGRNYKRRRNLRLRLGTMFVDEFVNYVFDKEIQQSDIKMVAIKLPLNYDMYTFSINLYDNLRVKVHMLEKMSLVIVQRS